jgi:hypothetical protein
MAIASLNSVNQLIFVTVKCGVLFEVRIEFLNIIYMSFVFMITRKGFDTKTNTVADRQS